MTPGRITGHPEVMPPNKLSTTRAKSRLLGTLIFAGPEFGNIVSGVSTPVLAKHSKSFSLIDCIAVGVDRMQRNFEPMRKQVEAWQRSELTDCHRQNSHLRGIRRGKTGSSQTPCPHDLYVEPKYEEFRHERSGVFPMRSRRHSKNWIPSRNSKRRRSWANTWKPCSHNCFS